MSQKTLLLVDDVDLFLELEKSFLSRESFSLHTARSGKEALEKVAALKPNLVLLDYFMPDLNGDAVCRQIKGTPGTRDIPVVITSTDSSETRKLSFEAGADEFLPKPLQRESLLRTIEEMLKVAQRRFPRIRARLDCLLRRKGEDRRTMIHCMSLGGVFIESPDPLASGERVVLSFRIPHPPMEFSVEGVVRWNGLLKRETPVRGAGIEFGARPPESIEALNAYIESKRNILSGLHTFSS